MDLLQALQCPRNSLHTNCWRVSSGFAGRGYIGPVHPGSVADVPAMQLVDGNVFFGHLSLCGRQSAKKLGRLLFQVRQWETRALPPESHDRVTAVSLSCGQ